MSPASSSFHPFCCSLLGPYCSEGCLGFAWFFFVPLTDNNNSPIDLHRNAEGQLDPLPNLVSLHSWFGLSAIILYILQVCPLLCIFPLIFFPSSCQFTGGFLTFFWPGLSLPLRKAFLPYHQLIGLIIFLSSTGTALLGISEYAAWHHR